MDEGFGSQDTQGRERLIEAINSVQADFDLIIVITHIEELKDAFPVRLEVVKGTQGSRVYVAG
jgi:exonuclease SbcC